MKKVYLFKNTVLEMITGETPPHSEWRRVTGDDPGAKTPHSVHGGCSGVSLILLYVSMQKYFR